MTRSTTPTTPPGPRLPVSTIGHADATGVPCAHHAEVAADVLLQLAMVGSRASAFHHDCASKLQGLVMALDELSELTEHGAPQLIRAIEAATESTRELHALLNINRALTKPAVKAAVGLGDLVTRAAQRVGIAMRTGQGEAMASATVEVSVAGMTHALALAFDVAAGVGRSRSLDLVTSQGGPGRVALSLGVASPAPGNASELLAIASFVIVRDGGTLWCTPAGDRLIIQLPAVG